VTAETGIVYVSQPEMLVNLQDDDITISLYVINNTRDAAAADDDDGDWESESSPSRWLPVANISIHVKRDETVYNVTSSTKRKHFIFVLYSCT